MPAVCILILPNAARTHVLLDGPAPHGSLPELVFDDPPYWQVVDRLNRAVRDRFGLSVTTLRCRSVTYDVNAVARRVYELELDDPGAPELAEHAWRRTDAVTDLPPEQQRILAAWRADAGLPAVPDRRVPWYHRTWRDPMRTWLRRSLLQSGRELTGPIEQLRSWERASVWRAATSGGVVYLKAVPLMFGHEPALTALLATQFPTLVPPVITVDVQRRWLVLANAGGRPLTEVAAIERWEDALRAYAEMQIALASQANALRSVGVPERGLAWLRAGLDRLLTDSGTFSAGPTGLSPQECDQLQAAAPALQAAIATLEHSGLPLTLEHGDFSPWQIQCAGTTIQILDWSDSSIAPPFFSLLGMLEVSTVALPDVPDGSARLRDAYLSVWSGLLGQSNLAELFDVAQQLAPLHHALIYYLDLLPRMEHRWEMAKMVPHYVRLLL